MGWNHWLALGLAACGVWALWNRLKVIGKNRGRSSWIEAAGRVRSSEVQVFHVSTGDGVDRISLPKVSYEYEVAGRTYTGDRYSSDRQGMSDKKARAYVERHPEGSHILVYVNPDDPEDALLRARENVDWFGPAFFFGVALAAALGWFGE